MAAAIASSNEDALSELLITQLLEEDMRSLASAKVAERLQLDAAISQSVQGKQRIPKFSKTPPKTDDDLAIEVLAADARLTSDATYAQMLQHSIDVDVAASRQSAMQLAAAERKAVLDAEFARRLQEADEQGFDITDARMMDAEELLGTDTISNIMASDPNNKGKGRSDGLVQNQAAVNREAFQHDHVIPIKREAAPSHPQESNGKGKGSGIKRVKLEVSDDIKLEDVKPNIGYPTCGICMEPFQGTSNPLSASRSANSSTRLLFGLRLPCPESHGYCMDCLASYINSKIDLEGAGATNTEAAVFPIRCPECTIVEWPIGIEDGVAERVLGEQAITLWHHRKLLESIPRYYCPNPRCSALVQLPEDQDQAQALCPSCSKVVCIPCRVMWHENMTCEEYQAIPLDERSAEDQMLLQLARAKNWRRCPNCSVIVELTVGCNHITCRCKTHFCFKCGSPWDIQAVRCTRDPPCDLWDEEMLLEARERERQAQHAAPAPVQAAPRAAPAQFGAGGWAPEEYYGVQIVNRDRRALDWMTDPAVVCGRHWFTNHMLQDLTCGYCDVRLNSVADLQYHLAHTMQHPVYTCCGRFFKRDIDFERHVNAVPRRFGRHIHQLETH